MDLQEKVTALEAEKKYANELIQHLTAEKTSLDQMCGEFIKTIFTIRKDLALTNFQFNELHNQMQIVNNEKEAIKKQLQELNEKLLVTE